MLFIFFILGSVGFVFNLGLNGDEDKVGLVLPRIPWVLVKLLFDFSLIMIALEDDVLLDY